MTSQEKVHSLYSYGNKASIVVPEGGRLGTEISRSWWTADFKIGIVHTCDTNEKGERNLSPSLPHKHSEYAFVFCLDGEMEFICGGQHYVLEPGEMLVHNAGQSHQSLYGTNQLPWEGVSLIVNGSVVNDLLSQMRSPCLRQRDKFMFLGKIRNPQVTRLVMDVVEELQSLQAGYHIAVRSLVVLVLVHLLRHAFEPTVVKPRANLHHQLPAWESILAMDYMYSRGKSHFRLSELCAILGTSRSRFIPLFRNSTSLYPHTYFNKVLMQRVQEMLRGREYSVKEVAYLLGFQSPSHFCTLFQSVVGTTPKQYQLLLQASGGNISATDVPVST